MFKPGFFISSFLYSLSLIPMDGQKAGSSPFHRILPVPSTDKCQSLVKYVFFRVLCNILLYI